MLSRVDCILSLYVLTII